jgi:hypothetical protein
VHRLAAVQLRGALAIPGQGGGIDVHDHARAVGVGVLGQAGRSQAEQAVRGR